MLKLLVLAALVVAAFVVFKLRKSGKAVTGASVVSGVESEVKSAVDAVKTDVSKK